MKLGIMYNPTNEYISFWDGNKNVLFTENEDLAQKTMNHITSQDNNTNDFSFVSVDYDTDGSDYTKGDNAVFVSASLLDNL